MILSPTSYLHDRQKYLRNNAKASNFQTMKWKSINDCLWKKKIFKFCHVIAKTEKQEKYLKICSLLMKKILKAFYFAKLLLKTKKHRKAKEIFSFRIF